MGAYEIKLRSKVWDRGINNFSFSEALVTLDVHSKDVVEELCRDKVVKNTDFQWLCQMRYYWLVQTINVPIILLIDWYSLDGCEELVYHFLHSKARAHSGAGSCLLI